MRASYEAAATTPRLPVPPTTTGRPRRSGRRRSSQDTKNAFMSTWRIAGFASSPLIAVRRGWSSSFDTKRAPVRAGDEVAVRAVVRPVLGKPVGQRLGHPPRRRGEEVTAPTGGREARGDHDAVGVRDGEITGPGPGEVRLDP